MDRLIVKNFGPLKDVDIELNKINLFIGENGSGKSVLAKLVTIILDIFNNHVEIKNDIEDKFLSFGLSYIDENTLIQYISSKHILFELNNKVFSQWKENNLAEEYNSLNLSIKGFVESKKTSERYKKRIESLENEISDNKKLQELKDLSQDIQNNLIEIEKAEKKSYRMQEQILSFSSQYIPAERNLISLFNKSLTTLLVAEVPLPKFLLKFSSEFEKAGNSLKELEFLNVKYVNSDGLDRHKVYFNDKNYLPLEQSSSGIQSSLPLYLTVKYFVKKHRSIIIEEPEQNLFPKAQAETIQYIIEQVSDDNNLFLMTHSPYVLSTLNILMMAYKAGNLNEESKKEVSEFFNEKQWINPDNFSAYYLENGVARDIKGRTGLISDNEIDDISDTIQEDFEELLAIYREHKNDK